MANTLCAVMKPCAHVTCKTCTDSLVRPAKQCIVCDTQLKEKDVIELKREGSFLFVLYPRSPSLSTFFFFIRLFSALFFWFPLLACGSCVGVRGFYVGSRLVCLIHASYGGLMTSYVWIHGSFA